MSSFEDPETGPVTTDYFLTEKSALATASPLASSTHVLAFKPMGVFQITGLAIGVYRWQFVQFFLPQAIVSGLYALAVFVLSPQFNVPIINSLNAAGIDTHSLRSTNSEKLLTQLSSVFRKNPGVSTQLGDNYIALIIFVLASRLITEFVHQIVLNSIVTHMTGGQRLGKPLSFIDAYRQSRARWIPLTLSWLVFGVMIIAIGFLFGFGLTGGVIAPVFFFGVVAGFQILPIIVLLTPTVSLESIGPTSALTRAWQLGRPYIGTIFFTLLVLGIVFLLASVIGAFILVFAHIPSSGLLGTMIGTWTGSFFAPLIPIGATILYIDARARFDQPGTYPVTRDSNRSARRLRLVLLLAIPLLCLGLGIVLWGAGSSGTNISSAVSSSNFVYASSTPYPTRPYAASPTSTPIVPIVKALRTYSGHAGAVSGVTFSPDGKIIVTSSGDGTVILWDTATGQKLRTFSGGIDQINSVAFSPDGKTILSGSSGNSVVLWDATSGQTLRTFTGHTDIVNSVAFSPDGKVAVSGSRDNTAILWDVASGSKLGTLTHPSAVVSVAFSPDGKWLLTGSHDNAAILWDVPGGNKLRTFSGHTSTVNAVAFSPDGSEILTGSRDDTAILWDAVTGKQLRTFTGHRSDVKSVVLSPDGKTILTGSDDKTAILWNADTGSKVGIVLNQPSAAIDSVAFSPDGKTILTGSDDYTARLWDISDLTATTPVATP